MDELTTQLHAFANACRENAACAAPHHQAIEPVVRAVISRAPRYAKAKSRIDGGSTWPLFGPTSHVYWFLKRTGFFDNASADTVAAEKVATALMKELTRDTCTVANLVLLDGLELSGTELALPVGRIVRLTPAFLGSWFSGQAPPGSVPASRVEGVFALEVEFPRPSPPWGGSVLELQSDERRVRDVIQPWLTYVNLYAADKCRAIGMYQRSDCLLHAERWRAVGIEEPIWEPQIDQDDNEFETLHRTLQIQPDDAPLRVLVERLAAGREAAGARTHRVETALRFFQRVSDTYMSHHVLGSGEDKNANEDLIVDAVAGLEAIYIGNEARNKSDRIAMRASRILAADIQSQRQLRKQALALYRLRSAILHGDEQKPANELRDNAKVAEELLRRSLIMFCRLEGDHAQVVQAETDPAQADRIRAMLSS